MSITPEDDPKRQDPKHGPAKKREDEPVPNVGSPDHKPPDDGDDDGDDDDNDQGHHHNK